jgi:hypothetical protein
VSDEKPRLSLLRLGLSLWRRSSRVDSEALQLEAPPQSGTLEGARLVSYAITDLGLSNDYLGNSTANALAHEMMSLGLPVLSDAQVLDAYRAYGHDFSIREIGDLLGRTQLLDLALGESEYWLPTAPDGCIYGRDENGLWLVVAEPWAKPLVVADLKSEVIERLEFIAVRRGRS